MSHALPAYVTVVATSTPTKVNEGTSMPHVVFLVVAGLALILLGIILSRRGSRVLRVGGPHPTALQ